MLRLMNLHAINLEIHIKHTKGDVYFTVTSCDSVFSYAFSLLGGY